MKPKPEPQPVVLHLSASAARKQALANRSGPVIEPLLAHVYERIKAACAEGKTSIVHPFHGFISPPFGDTAEAVWAALRAQGYTVIHHPDPDPGHPASGPYDEVSWEDAS